MPFSASARNDVWDHDAEGDAFVPPPPHTLPASLRPKPSHDAWLLHELGAQNTHAAGPGLVRRGRHAPARDGSESSDLRRARVRLAQLEPVLDDARRDARLADRARRTAECERDRANALLETMREETREILRCADEQRAALCDAERDVAAALRKTRELEKARDEATKKVSLVVLETDELRTNAQKHEETAQKHLRDLTRLRAAFLKATQTSKKDAGTNTAAFSDAFDDVLSERYASGFSDGDASRGKATRDVLERERELAEAARDAAHARASDAEARVARLAASLERTREAAAAERKRAAAINATRDADAAASKKKALAAEKALCAAETREAVFRARLEAMALALASRVRETDSTSHDPSNDEESPFGAKEVRVKSRVAPRARDAAFEKKKRTGRASKPRKSSSALATRSRSRASSPERRIFAPAAPLRSSGDSSSGGCETNAPVRGGNHHDDWLPEVRPPPRMLA
jgi:chromosome segregation ATPase